MISNNFEGFVNTVSDSIRVMLNSDMGQELVQELLTESLKKNPNMTQEEWSQIKSEFMTFIFASFVQEIPEAMEELAIHTYNELVSK